MNILRKASAMLLGIAAVSAAVHAEDYDWEHPQETPTKYFIIQVDFFPVSHRTDLNKFENISEKTIKRLVTSPRKSLLTKDKNIVLSHDGMYFVAEPVKFEPGKWNEYSFSFKPNFKLVPGVSEGEVVIYFVPYADKMKYEQLRSVRKEMAKFMTRRNPSIKSIKKKGEETGKQLDDLAWMRIANVQLKNAASLNDKFGKKGKKLLASESESKDQTEDANMVPDGTFANGMATLKRWFAGEAPDFSSDKRLVPVIEDDPSAPGGRCLRISNHDLIFLVVKVKRDQTLTFSFSAKPDVIIPSTR